MTDRLPIPRPCATCGSTIGIECDGSPSCQACRKEFAANAKRLSDQDVADLARGKAVREFLADRGEEIRRRAEYCVECPSGRLKRTDINLGRDMLDLLGVAAAAKAAGL